MPPTELIAAILLLAGLALQIISALGVLIVRGDLNKLHYVSLASTAGAPPLAAAVALHSSQEIVPTILVGVILLATGPIVTHATAHALGAPPQPDESGQSSPPDKAPGPQAPAQRT